MKLHPSQSPLSVLGVAKRRQRRKRKKQPKRSPARQWQQRDSRSGSKVATSKGPTQEQYQKIHSTNQKVFAKRQQGETCWTGGESDNKFKSGINLWMKEIELINSERGVQREPQEVKA